MRGAVCPFCGIKIKAHTESGFSIVSINFLLPKNAESSGLTADTSFAANTKTIFTGRSHVLTRSINSNIMPAVVSS